MGELPIMQHYLSQKSYSPDLTGDACIKIDPNAIIMTRAIIIIQLHEN